MKSKFDSIISTVDCYIREGDYEHALRSLIEAIELVADRPV